MRSTTLLLSTLLYAGALAHPFHSHQKRDETKLVNEYEKDNTLVREYEVVHKVYVPAGGDYKPQTSEKAETPVVHVDEHKQDAAPQRTYKHKSPNHVTWKPVQKQVETKPQEKPQEEVKQVVKKPDPAPAPEQPKPEQADTSSSDTSSSGNSDLDTVNSMRKKWRPSLPGYKWSENLLNNVKNCVDSSPNQMVHKLVPGSGSFGQVLAPTDGDLKAAMTMWLCEQPGGSLSCPNGQTKGIGEDSQGHAKILSDTSHGFIACYCAGKVCGCDVGDA